GNRSAAVAGKPGTVCRPREKPEAVHLNEEHAHGVSRGSCLNEGVLRAPPDRRTRLPFDGTDAPHPIGARARRSTERDARHHSPRARSARVLANDYRLFTLGSLSGNGWRGTWSSWEGPRSTAVVRENKQWWERLRTTVECFLREGHGP